MIVEEFAFIADMERFWSWNDSGPDRELWTNC